MTPTPPAFHDSETLRRAERQALAQFDGRKAAAMLACGGRPRPIEAHQLPRALSFRVMVEDKPRLASDEIGLAIIRRYAALRRADDRADMADAMIEIEALAPTYPLLKRLTKTQRCAALRAGWRWRADARAAAALPV